MPLRAIPAITCKLRPRLLTSAAIYTKSFILHILDYMLWPLTKWGHTEPLEAVLCIACHCLASKGIRNQFQKRAYLAIARHIVSLWTISGQFTLIWFFSRNVIEPARKSRNWLKLEVKALIWTEFIISRHWNMYWMIKSHFRPNLFNLVSVWHTCHNLISKTVVSHFCLDKD